MPLGFLPGGPDVDRATMNRTLDAVLKTWDWETKIWGWDYPMIAMTATRLGRPDVAGKYCSATARTISISPTAIVRRAATGRGGIPPQSANAKLQPIFPPTAHCFPRLR